jgi:SAM-dependent methyltransferase
MHWQMKAAIMRLCSRFPLGDRLYMIGQKKLGRLQANPLARLPIQVKMTRWLMEQGILITGSCLFEVGSGNIPLVPIGFFLSGAGRVITVDLHKRIDWGLTRSCLEWIALHRGEVQAMYSEVVDLDLFNERLAVLARRQSTPQRFLEEAGIEYWAPQDAARTSLPAASVDCHFSVTTLEHIPPATLNDIFKEARRILKSNGAAIHFVDLSDHFQHQDRSITQINFLRFSEAEWEKIAYNEFAYCNRLRASDYLRLFAALGYKQLRVEGDIDSESLQALKDGFRVDGQFMPYSSEDLCTCSLRGVFRSDGSLGSPAS